MGDAGTRSALGTVLMLIGAFVQVSGGSPLYIRGNCSLGQAIKLGIHA